NISLITISFSHRSSPIHHPMTSPSPSSCRGRERTELSVNLLAFQRAFVDHRSLTSPYIPFTMNMLSEGMDAPKLGFSLELCSRNGMLMKKGLKPPGHLKLELPSLLVLCTVPLTFHDLEKRFLFAGSEMEEYS
ncbi:hypothetical protein M8C21_032828, partial [Ambrosia artemisiifolia]